MGSSKPNARAAGLATCLALSSPADWPMAPAFLSELHEDFFHAFIAELPGSEHCTRVHDRLRADKGICTVLVDRLIRLRSKAPEPGVENLLSALGCDQPAWHDYWLKNEGANLVAALERLSDDSPLARRLWANLIARVTLENFASGGESGIGPLVAIRDRFARPLAVEQQERLDGWNAINLAFVNPPPTQPPGAARALASACRAVGAAREELAEQWFRTRVITAQKISEAKEKSEKLGRSLLGFYETEESAFAQALKLADEVRNEQVRAGARRRFSRQSSRMKTAINSRESSKASSSRHRSGLRPEVDLRQKAPRKAAGRKGVGFGRFRLSEQATRYVLAFAGGAACTVLLMIVLSSLLANALSSVSARWRPTNPAQATDAEQKAKQELDSELAEKNRKLGESQTLIDTLKTRNRELSERLAFLAKTAESTTKPEEKPTPGKKGDDKPAPGQAGQMAHHRAAEQRERRRSRRRVPPEGRPAGTQSAAAAGSIATSGVSPAKATRRPRRTVQRAQGDRSQSSRVETM